jgi:hypothetical protein
MHLTDDQIQRIMHDELAAPAASEVRRHLAECSSCQAVMDQAQHDERWVLDRLAALDHARPVLRAADITTIARSQRGSTWGRWAAGILLASGLAGAAYAAPGSPLPKMLARLLQSDTRPVEVPALPRPAGRDASQVGIAVLPGTRLTISFETARTGDTARVFLSDDGDVVVRARGGATSFDSDPERVRIVHRGSPGWFEIGIPRAAPLVEIEVAGRRILRKEQARLSAEVAADALGRYLIPLAAP